MNELVGKEVTVEAHGNDSKFVATHTGVLIVGEDGGFYVEGNDDAQIIFSEEDVVEVIEKEVPRVIVK